MDVHKALRELYEEKKRLDAAISILEGRLRRESRSGIRRGRKKMSPEERMQVSKRMSQYWEGRRAQRRALQAAAEAESRDRDAN